MKITEFLSDIGRPVAFHPGLRKITGSTTATLLLCQLIYWTGKQADPDGWIYKTSDDLEEETGLTYDEQATARKQLLKLGFIEESYKRLDHQMKFRIMANAIDEEWRKLNHAIPESRITALGKAESGHSLNESQTTPQTTTKTTPDTKDASFELAQTFTRETGIAMYQNQKWVSSVDEMAEMGITPDIIHRAIAELKKKKFSITGPWSIQRTAVGMISGGNQSGGFEVVNG